MDIKFPGDDAMTALFALASKREASEDDPVEIQLCPFCGSAEIEVDVFTLSNVLPAQIVYAAVCRLGCDARGAHAPTAAKAWENWNRRA